MKIFRLLTASLLIAVCAGFSSCGDDELDKKPLEPVIDEITISDASFDFEANGGEKTLSFSTNRDWTVSLANTANGENWCTVTPLNGKAGDNNIQIRVAANKGYDDRNVSLTIAAGGTSRTVIINQKQQDALTLTANKFEVGKNGGKINVEVKANIQYEVIISETSKSWISQSAKTRGLTSNNLSFDIAPSEEYDKRTGEIIIKSGEFSETVHVYQSGEGVLLLTKSEYSVSDKGETIAVDLKSNFEFDVKMPDVDWVQSAAKTRGMSSHTLYYTIAPNETYDSREAEIIFYDKNSSIKDTLKIVQAQKNAIIISQKDYNVAANGEIIEVELSANIDYTVLIPSDYKWITQMPTTKGLINNKLYFEIASNIEEHSRNGIVVFQNDIENDTINIFQEGAVYDPSTIHLHIEMAGSLSSMIAASKKYQIANLTLTGTINDADIRFLKEMAGFRTEGKLAKLDITKCEIVDALYRPNNIIASNMFSYCEALETILLPQKVTEIGASAFSECTNLSSVTIPNSVLSIGFNCFFNCISLQNIILPNSLNTISESAFQDCKNLTSINIPSNVKSISARAFDGCINLQAINVAPDNPYCKSIQGVLFDKKETTLIRFPAGLQMLTYEIPNNIKYLGYSAFESCTKLTSVTVNNEIEYIDGYSFSNCKSLKSITLGKNIRRLEYSTFSDCTQLQEIHCLPITPTTITEFCFDSEVLNNCKLYIPKATYNDYWIAQGWGDFKNIIEGDGSIDSALIIGNWKLLTHNGQVATHVTFNNDGTFLYTSVNDGAYSEHGIYKIENNILYEKFSDEDTWCMSEIFTLNSIALTLRDLDENGITYVGDSYTYQRVE